MFFVKLKTLFFLYKNQNFIHTWSAIFKSNSFCIAFLTYWIYENVFYNNTCIYCLIKKKWKNK